MTKFSLLIQRVGAGSLLRFLLLNFSTPITFYLTFHWVGTRAAIEFAIAVAAVQTLVYWIASIPFSPFFISATVFTVLFGGAELFGSGRAVFRFEPMAENAAVGLVFAVSVIMGRPILSWFASAVPRALVPLTKGRSASYLRGLTGVWAVYFFTKAAIFYWLACRVDLGRLFVLRSVLGGGSGILLIGGELALNRARRRKEKTQ